jgi:hypothetical protein
VYSEVSSCLTSPTRLSSTTLAAARAASAEQEIRGHSETIDYEDDKGAWHSETASGRDRPHTVIKDVD